MPDSEALSPATRDLACQFSLPVTLVPTSIRWNESLGRPFDATLIVVTDAATIDPVSWIGQPMSVTVGQTSDDPVSMHGIIDMVKELSFDDELRRLEIRLVPWIDLLRHVGGCQINQQQSVVEIIESIADRRGFSGMLDNRLTNVYEARDYCVQYNESELDFIHRLMEEEGIYYFFEYSESSHTLVLCDDVAIHASAAAYDSLPYRGSLEQGDSAAIGNWTSERQFTTASVLLDDYDFQKPRVDLTVRQESSPTPAPWWRTNYSGRFFDIERGQTLSRIQSEAIVSRGQSIGVRSNVAAVHTGHRINVTEHPIDSLDRDYIVTSSRLNIQTSELTTRTDESVPHQWHADWTMQPGDVPFRLPSQTPRPPMLGPQVARVVGPENQEIWTDQYGRVKVQFLWDRTAPGDDSSSCWIRVTQGWTGQNYGMMSVPRVGEEVVVQFFNGDIDRPIIIGRVGNASMMPPEDLPDAQAKTILRTRSTPGGNAQTFHELTFDDTKDAEAIYLHSERDLIREVENNDSLKVGFEKQDPGDQSIDVFHDRTVHVGNDLSSKADQKWSAESGDDMSLKSGNALSIESSDTTSMKSGAAMSIESDDAALLKSAQAMTIKSGAALSVQSSDAMSLKSGSKATVDAGTEMSITAATKLTLQCGGSQIVLEPSMITIKGAMVMIN